LFQDLVLAKGEEAFKEVLGKGKTNDELLPGEEGPIEDSGKALGFLLAMSESLQGNIVPEGYP
jgi:hypothetical protein